MNKCSCKRYLSNPNLTFCCDIKIISAKFDKDLTIFTKHYPCKISFDHCYTIENINMNK